MPDPAVQSAIAAGRVPDGITAAYLDQSRDEGTIIAIGVVCALATVILFARILARAFILKRVGLDDGLAVVSWTLLIAFVGLCILLIQLGSGRHYDYIQYVLDEATVDATEIYDFVAHIIYTTSLVFCRLSGLALYATIANNHKSYIRGIRIVAVFIVLMYLLQVFLIIFHCTPVTGLWPYAWQPRVNDFTCLQWGLVYSVNSAVSLCNDLLLYGIPTVMIWRLEMSRKRKIQLACILLPGVLVIAISVARLVLVIKGQWETDESWEYDPMLAVETSEIGFTIISLSVPGCKLIYDKIFHGSSSGGTTMAQQKYANGFLTTSKSGARKSSGGLELSRLSTASGGAPADYGDDDVTMQHTPDSHGDKDIAVDSDTLDEKRERPTDLESSGREDIVVKREYQVESVPYDQQGESGWMTGRLQPRDDVNQTF